MECFAGILGVRLSKEGQYCLGSGGVDPGPRNLRAGHGVALSTRWVIALIADEMVVIVASLVTVIA